MGYVVQVVFGFECIVFARDLVGSATFVSQSFYTHGVDMDYQFQIWSAKWKQHTSLQIECMTLLMERNNVEMQIVSSHTNSYEEMKEGNYFIHVGMVICNFPCFEC
jgi:hypothetical protein